MLHEPHTEVSPCYDKNKDICKKNFPKNFQSSTSFKKMAILNINEWIIALTITSTE